MFKKVASTCGEIEFLQNPLSTDNFSVMRKRFVYGRTAVLYAKKSCKQTNFFQGRKQLLNLDLKRLVELQPHVEISTETS